MTKKAMPSGEFRSALKSLGLRQSWLAARLGVAQSTVNHWATGKAPVAPYVPFILELLRDAADQRQQIAFLLSSTERLLDCDLVATHDDIRERLDAMQAQEDARETRQR